MTQQEIDKVHAEWLMSGRSFTVQSHWVGCPWLDCENPNWLPDRDWRKKPEQKRVPFGPQDIKPGMMLRHDTWVAGTWRSIGEVSLDGVFFSSYTIRTWKDLQECWLWSMDGKTWNKCEKEEG